MERRGVSRALARDRVRARPTLIASLMVRRGEADALICGTIGRYRDHLTQVLDVIGRKPGSGVVAALSLLILPRGSFFLLDTHATPEPTAEEIAESTLMAATEVRRFGIVPKIALLSHSNFGTANTPSAIKMRSAVEILTERAPNLEIEGEMQGDTALLEEMRRRIFPNSRLKGTANLLVMPTLDAGNIAYTLLRVLGEGLSVGPMLLGAARPAHVLTPAVTVRGIVNMSVFTAVHAQDSVAAAAAP
jgi:malate dehydrogenase (oxaloacetate-decarboxylating)(NADP+)